MSLRVLFFASLKDITGMRDTRIDATEFTNVNSVFEKFVKDFPALGDYRATVLFAVNSEFARPEYPVHDGDEIAFFPPVSGG